MKELVGELLIYGAVIGAILLVAGIASGNPGLIIAGSLLTAAGVGAVTYAVVEHRNGRNAVTPAAQQQNAATPAIAQEQTPQPAALDEVAIAVDPIVAEGGMPNDDNDRQVSRSPSPSHSDSLSRTGHSPKTRV